MEDKGLKIVVLRYFYTLEELQPNKEQVLKEITQELEVELLQKIAKPRKIELFENNPKGVAKIKFSSSEEAEECIKLMNGRFFD